MGSVLVLGAGVYQIPIIKTVKELGLFSVVASIPGDYPGFAYADAIEYVDTRDFEHLLRIAKQHNVAGVLTAGTDVAISSVGYICDKLGLPGLSYRAACLSTNKTNMKVAFREAGVHTAAFEIVAVDSSINTCTEVASRLGYPVIFKAVDSSGSRGITRVDNSAAVEHALSEVLSATRSKTFIIEKFLEGIEFGLQLFMQDGCLSMAMLHGDYVSPGVTSVPMGHFVPFGDEQLRFLAVTEAEKAAHALGITDGAVNVDAILCNSEVYIIEVGARAGATLLPELVSERFEWNYYEAIVQRALGNASVVPTESNKCAVGMILCPNRGGVVTSIDGLPNVDEHIKLFALDISEGARIHKFHVGPDRIGHILAVGKDLKDAENNLAKGLKQVRIKMSDGDYLDWLTPRAN